MENLIESYLVSLGLKLSLKNQYLKIDDYEYKSSGKEKKVNIAGKQIPLNITTINTIHLLEVMKGARNALMNDIKKEDDEFKKIGIGERYFNLTCDMITNKSLIYFTEYMKYISEKFELNETIFNLIVLAINNSYNTIQVTLKEVLNKYNINYNNAYASQQAYEIKLDNQFQNELSNAPKMYTGRYVGDTWHGYVSSIVSDTKKQGYKNAKNELSAMHFASEIKLAGDNAEESIIMARDKVISDFEESIKDIIFSKFKKYFNLDVVNNDKDLEKNPLSIEGWQTIFNNVTEDDFLNIKEVDTYYNLNLKDVVSKLLSKNVSEYYKNNFKCDYNEIDAKLYLYLSGHKDLSVTSLGNNNGINIAIYNYFYYFNKNRTEKDYKKDKKGYLKEISLIEENIYLTKEDKEKLIKNIKDKIKDFKKDGNKKLLKIIAILILIIAIISLFFIFSFKDIVTFVVIVIFSIIFILGFIFGLMRFFGF